MFCSGCTARLPAFKPTGPSALQAMKDGRSPFDFGANGTSTQTPVRSARALRADSSYFWQGLGLLVLAMALLFAAWFAYVTRKADGPEPSRVAVSAPTPAMAPAVASVSRASPEVPANVAVVAAMAAPAKSVDVAPETTRASASAPASAMALPAAEPPTAAPADRRALKANRAGDSRPMAVRSAPSYRNTELASPQGQRTVAVARNQDDPGPPIAAGPGPLYGGSTPRSSRMADDPGPPVVAGPGPMYQTPRTPVRAPVWLANDPGPPIAIGPGPQVDYSAGRGGSPR
jgi:hypothetical protein